MFTRTVWRLRRLFDISGALREMDVRTDPGRDIFGLGNVGFSDMVDGHFNRAEPTHRSHRPTLK